MAKDPIKKPTSKPAAEPAKETGKKTTKAAATAVEESAEVKALKKELASVKKENEELKEVNAEKDTVIDEMTGKLNSSAAAGGSSNQLIEHGGKTYRMKHPSVKYQGVNYTAESLRKNTDVLAKLIKIEWGGLEKVK